MASNVSLSAFQSIVVSEVKAKQTASFAISTDILDDLASRFIINVPVEERENLIRICFQVELAHWFYLDFYCSENKQKCGIKQFAQQIFKHVPFLQPHWPQVDEVLENWKQYKLTVPTYGAILLSEDLKHVLLVQSFWAKSSWGFPKGKINEHEEPEHCAIREVYEETGYDIKNLIKPSEYIEMTINYQYTRLYLVPGVPLTTVFEPKTRNEIKCCSWFPVEQLPVTKHENLVKDNQNFSGNSFFMILPFVKRLKRWIEKPSKGNKQTGKGGIHLQATNSPVPGGRDGSGKQKIFFENNLNNGAGGSGSKNQSGNPQALQQQQGQRARQRHKSMGELEPQNPGSRVKNTFGTPTVNQIQQLQPQQQQQQGGPNQPFYKNSPNYSQQQQQLAGMDLSRSQRATSVTGDGGYQDFSAGIVEGSSAWSKKSLKKADHSVISSGGSVTGIGQSAERAGKNQTKRKLFDNFPPSTDEQPTSGGHVAKDDGFAEFDKVKAWVAFRLDYSKFL
ncbi:m7GpppN-mRNA hydrolase-like [Anopheles albimanus]|uniref:m7GpppN-mRNA hydrolase-like n=1 Tax=Anopheles albimanus TaxID=7167 RepID=UPI0016408C9C|nr:m7GpppN-mRNA hydrolase-like [Anopheles albimanus]